VACYYSKSECPRGILPTLKQGFNRDQPPSSQLFDVILHHLKMHTCNMMGSATIITLANEMPAGYLTAAAYVQLDHTRYTRFVRTSR
jgi:hypothetical protein